jgi:hypothetical protein
MIREGENSGTCSVHRPVESRWTGGDSARVDAGPRVVMGGRDGSDRPTGHLHSLDRSLFPRKAPTCGLHVQMYPCTVTKRVASSLVVLQHYNLLLRAAKLYAYRS